MKQKHIQHLYLRSGFGIDTKVLDKIKSKPKSKIIEYLFSDSEKMIPLQLNLTEFNLIKNNAQLKLCGIIKFYRLQLISLPQHCGDFIFPSHLGQLETCTLSPLSKEMCPFINGSLHLAQLALTAIPQLSHL